MALEKKEKQTAVTAEKKTVVKKAKESIELKVENISTIDPNRLYTIEETAQLLKIEIEELVLFLKNKKLYFAQVGKNILILGKFLLKFIEDLHYNSSYGVEELLTPFLKEEIKEVLEN